MKDVVAEERIPFSNADGPTQPRINRVQRTYTLFSTSSGLLRRYAILPLKALTRHLWSPPKPAAPLHAMVVTPGGAASTTLLKHIARYVTVNDCNDADGLKHAPFPPRWFDNARKTRVIFIDRDITRILHSLDRRGYVCEQLAKLGSVIGCLLPDAFAKKVLVKAINRQKHHWRTTKSADVMFIEYETLWDQVDKIATFLGITDSSFTRDFPPMEKSRTPTTRAASPITKVSSLVPDLAQFVALQPSVNPRPSSAKIEVWAMTEHRQAAATTAS